MSDNGPQFTSREFTNFAKTWGISLTMSSPGYPKSNRLIKKAVQISENIMTKATENGEDPFLGILDYRNTPVDGFVSPAQLLMSRQLRSILPCTSQHLKKKVIPTTQFTQQRTEMLKRQKLYHDKSARSLKQLTPGDAVYIQKTPDRPWSQAVVLSHAGQPQSYWVHTNKGSMLRRNHKHLTACPHQSQQGLSQVSETSNEAAPPTTEMAIESPPSASQPDLFMSLLPMWDGQQASPSPNQMATISQPQGTSKTPLQLCMCYGQTIRRPLKLNL